MWAALLGAAAATTATSTCAADSTCADVDAARSLFLRWVNSTSIPGEYTTAATRLAHSSHPGDLTHTRIFYDGPLGATTSDRPWPHTRPNPVYSSESARAQMLDAVAFLLWRGVSRLQDAVLPLLGSVAASQLDHLLSLVRRALDSFEDFYRSVR